VKVARASLRDGLLTIELQRDIPEALKPRRIEIRSEGSSTVKVDRKTDARQIEAQKSA
jgi:molecular chaperone IbpA